MWVTTRADLLIPPPSATKQQWRTVPPSATLGPVTSAEMISIRAAAARNNADWCATVSSSHGIVGTFDEAAWWSSRRTPPYYPDAVTLRHDAAPADFLPGLDTGSPGCTVKDSFATLDLTSDGFSQLFSAQWIHRAAGIAVPATPGLRIERVRSADQLRAWQAAWQGGDEALDIFRSVLLDDPSVLVLAVRDGETRIGGVVLNRSTDVVGLSNLFAATHVDPTAIWSAALTAAADHFPGLPTVGYEQGDDLLPALDSGFTVLGPLRVWRYDS